jgi:copper type II ascorbate-dependent monooxygenase-like protein
MRSSPIGAPDGAQRTAAAASASNLARSGGAVNTPDGWTTLQVRPWSIEAGSETMPDYGFTPDRDYTITAIRAVDPPGTHHVDLFGPGPFHNVLFVAVVGTGSFSFPDGVGLKLRAGDDLSLQIHVVNATTHTLDGTSGVDVFEASSPAVLHEANILNPGLDTLSLPPGVSQAGGTCTLTADQTLFAIGPHMHLLGTHIWSAFKQGGTTRVLLDEDFRFNEQVFVSFDPIDAHAGDTIDFQCTWNNTTDQTVQWGLNSHQEMCSVFVYRYPAASSDLCTH